MLLLRGSFGNIAPDLLVALGLVALAEGPLLHTLPEMPPAKCNGHFYRKSDQQFRKQHLRIIVYNP